MARHGAGDLKLEPAVAADVAHLPARVAGHEAIIDPGHDASMMSTLASFLISDHLLFN